MTVISASDVKKLREQTGAGMLDCKKALDENKGDFEAAVDWLRKKGLATAAKKSGRVAAEGLVAVAVDGSKGAIIEINSETDFVARNEQFQALVAEFAKAAIAAGGDIEKLKSEKGDQVTKAIATIGENISLRRAALVTVSEGVVASYIHSAAKPGMGKIGVLVGVESKADKAALNEVGKQIAMHIAAANPIALTRAEVPASNLEREKEIFAEQARASGKPADIIEKMVVGRINKFYGEVVLPEQLFIIDGKTKVEDVVKAKEKEIGAPIKLTQFVHFKLGEGIEKEEKDFAAEVKAVASA